jgi:hypothetical protein
LHFFEQDFRNQIETCDSSEEGFRELETPICKTQLLPEYVIYIFVAFGEVREAVHCCAAVMFV